MGGEGSMLAAIKSLKNNRDLLKRKGKGALSVSYKGVELKEFPESTPKQLLEIKKRIRKENKQLRIKQLIVFSVFIIALVAFFFYLIH